NDPVRPSADSGKNDQGRDEGEREDQGHGPRRTWARSEILRFHHRRPKVGVVPPRTKNAISRALGTLLFVVVLQAVLQITGLGEAPLTVSGPSRCSRSGCWRHLPEHSRGRISAHA